MKTLVKFLKDESGATAIEYGLIAAGIAIAIITAVQGVGSQLSTNFGTISTSLKESYYNQGRSQEFRRDVARLFFHPLPGTSSNAAPRQSAACLRMAGQMFPFGATYLPVFSHASSLNVS